jgi:hypothetical protein
MRSRLGDQGEPYRRGTVEKLGRLSEACIVTGAALLARGGRSRRSIAALGGALMSAGALSARWSVFKAGFQSAADPKYVVAPQRARITSGERRGAARSQASVAVADASRGSPATVA